MKELSICADLKSAAARRNEGKRFNALSEFENFGRQTDGLRRVVSNHAVFDRDVGFHVSSFPKKRVRGARETVKLRGESRVISLTISSGGGRFAAGFGSTGPKQI